MRPQLLLLLAAAVVHAQHTAAVHEVQPSSKDLVHAVWMNGPSLSSKLPSSSSAAWPAFKASASTRAGERCATRDDTSYTGYDSDGRYCEAASTKLDDEAHLLLHSGRLGLVVDAGGLEAGVNGKVPSRRNLFPKLGGLISEPATCAFWP